MERISEAQAFGDMMLFLATEGFRKCPICGRYAKSNELGHYSVTSGNARIEQWGHLPGYGCNVDSPLAHSGAPSIATALADPPTLAAYERFNGKTQPAAMINKKRSGDVSKTND